MRLVHTNLSKKVFLKYISAQSTTNFIVKKISMNSLLNLNRYQKVFSKWAGGNIKLSDDFETICDCDYDFIELLLVYEKEFSLNLLDTATVRQDFESVRDFLAWIISQPEATECHIPFRFHEPEVIPILL